MLLKTNNTVPPELMQAEAALRNPKDVVDDPKRGKVNLAKPGNKPLI